MRLVAKLRAPVLMLHSEEAAVPQSAKAFLFDFYDRPSRSALRRRQR